MEGEKKGSLELDEEKETPSIASVVDEELPDDGDSCDPDLHDLPHELRGLRDKTFDFEDELYSQVVSRGFGDTDIILDPNTKKARFRMTSGAHDEVTGVYTNAFNEDWCGIATAHGGTCNIFIQPLPGRAITKRKPDIAFWGPAKCDTIFRAGRARTTVKHLEVPPKLHSVTREQIEKVNPDVIFKFSWENGEGYEVKAIDEMMSRALVTYPHDQPNNDAPTLGFLVKIRTANRRNAIGQKIIRCIDVYRLPLGTNFEDAKANRRGASHQRFVPGQADVVVEITPQDLKITSSASNTPPPQSFRISAADVKSTICCKSDTILSKAVLHLASIHADLYVFVIWHIHVCSHERWNQKRRHDGSHKLVWSGRSRSHIAPRPGSPLPNSSARRHARFITVSYRKLL